MIGVSKGYYCTGDGEVREFGKGGGGVPVYGKDFTYTGEYQICDDSDNNWRIKFLTSGTFIPLTAMLIDVFLVGGGGGGGCINAYYAQSQAGSTTGFNQIALGGYPATNVQMAKAQPGGNGGSGGGGITGGGNNGGSDGSNGLGNSSGAGQGTTTREFGESTGDLYAGGGGGGCASFDEFLKNGGSGGGGSGGYYEGNNSSQYAGRDGTANTGGGGGGDASSAYAYSCGGGGGYTTTQKSVYLEKDKTYNIMIGNGGTGLLNTVNNLFHGGTGGSGILIIRKHKE